MRNLLLTLAFDGTAYHGWQVQANAVTVQQTVQDAAERICGRREPLTGCSRTDAGVHANEYCCTLRTESAIACETLVQALNALLPRDIAVSACREMPAEFHPRYDCAAKEYVYRIWNAPQKHPFLYKYAYHFKYPLDAGLLHSEAQAYLGTHDYSAFCAAGGSVEDHVRTVTAAAVEREGDLVIFRVTADGFLYNMVRIMTGTLLEIAGGKLPQGCIPAILASGERGRAGFTAPAHGLFLNHVFYAPEGRGEENDGREE
ncbi:MAG: tRNA pseudouridine(38-40) synthase TruA [Clostridia bacterium]|nr:tRNA pseudouridine(38-40) synthase TruA [Clostridia bacterium]